MNIDIDEVIRIIPASGKSGKDKDNDNADSGMKVSVHVPTSWVRQMEILVKNQKLPYLNKGEFMRNAIWLMFQVVEQAADIQYSTLSIINTIIDGLEHHKRQELFTRSITMLRDRVNQFSLDGRLDLAAQEVEKVRMQLKHIPNAYWRDKYNTLLDKEFGHLTDKLPKISLLAKEDD
jgi:dynactin complex subunit